MPWFVSCDEKLTLLSLILSLMFLVIVSYIWSICCVRRNMFACLMVCVGDGCDMAADGEDQARVGDLVWRIGRITHKWVLDDWTIGRLSGVKGGPYRTHGGVRFGPQNQRLRFASLTLKTSGVGLPGLASKPVVVVDGDAWGVITEIA